MSVWNPGGGSSSGGNVFDFKDTGSSVDTAAPKVWSPTPSGQPGNNTVSADPNEPPAGVVQINPFAGGITPQTQDPVTGLLQGLRNALFGSSQADAEGKHGGLLGGIPVYSDLMRAGTEAIANAGGAIATVGGAAIDAAVKRAPAPVSPQDNEQLNKDYEAIPAEFRKTYDEAIKADDGIFGSGFFAEDAHWKSLAVREWRKEAAKENPTLAPGAFTTPGSIGDVFPLIMDAWNVGAESAASGWAQLDTPGQDGGDRIDLIMAVGRGEKAFNPDEGVLGSGFLAGEHTSGLNAIEQTVYDRVSSGDWTRQQAADFLATNGAAYSHSAAANLAGSVALDPLNIAALGAGSIAKLGATGAARLLRVEKIAERVAELEKVAQEANVAREGLSGTKLAEAERTYAAAVDTLEQARASQQAFNVYHAGGSVRRINVIARVAEGSPNVAKALNKAGLIYRGLEDTNIGRTAKLVRTLIDPLHALDLHMPGSSRTLDLMSDAIPASVVDTLGVQHYKGILNDLISLDSSGSVAAQFADDLGVASSNLGREGVLEMYRAAQMQAGRSADLLKLLPEEAMDTAIASMKQRDVEKWLRYAAVKHVQQDRWTGSDIQTLARQLHQMYPSSRTLAEWTTFLNGANKETRSLLKFASYGASNRRLLKLVGEMSPEVAAKLPVPPGRMVLIAKSTPTRQFGEKLLTELSKKGVRTKRKLELIRAAQQAYPGFSYIPLDHANLPGSIDKFVEWLDEAVDRMPMQMLDEEINALGPSADDLRAVMGEYSLGFRPDDQFLWGIERSNTTGEWKAAGMAWADHVADVPQAYRPFAALRKNIMGHAIVDVPGLRVLAKPLDAIDSGARVLKSQVSGAMITEAARKKFVAEAISDERLAANGVTEDVANDWFRAIQEYTRERQGYSGPRGMSTGELYKAIQKEGLIPQPLMNGEYILQPRDIMSLVLRAYDGDIRYIGLTQKLSARAKSVLSFNGQLNWAGQIAEHAWPTMKFRYNPIFQMQEKVEPWVLNAQRGVSFATGVEMSEADRATEALLARMTDNSLVRMGDLDQFEYSSEVLFGGLTKKLATDPASRMNKITRAAAAITEVQGMKRVNMLRTFRKGLGKELRQAWEEARPGDWDKMKLEADLRLGRVLDEDDFAIQFVSENMLANDILVDRLSGAAGKFGKADWANAIKPGVWSAPTTLGELKGLDLQHVVESLRVQDRTGKELKTLEELRGAMAEDGSILDKVLEGLARHGADKDYIRRVDNALNFSWNTFWKTAAERFSLTDEESRALQDFVAGAASMRGMTPVEFMSQVFSPTIRNGMEGSLGHLEGVTRILREGRAAGRKVKAREARLAESRSVLAGKAGESTREDLVKQLSSVFSAHLDPSAKRMLLLEFNPEIRQAVKDGHIRMDLDDVENMWDSVAEDNLSSRILGYMDGREPTAPYRPVREDEGLLSVRQASDRYMAERGVTPREEKPYFELDQDHYDRVAQAYGDLKPTPYEKTGARPTIKQVREAGLELKPKPDDMDETTYRAYQMFNQDTAAQFEFMTRPKEKGGMGIKVVIAKSDPYASSAEMRADIAKGQIRVLGDSSDHPLLTNAQNVRFRAVHDVFGHSANGFEFGPRGELNAAAHHARMYSDEGRAALLTETHGQTAYNNFSHDIIQDAPARTEIDPNSPISSFAKAFSPEGGPYDTEVISYGRDLAGMSDPNLPDVTLELTFPNLVGPDISELPLDQQHFIMQNFAELFDQFPEYRPKHLDVYWDMHEPAGPGYTGLGLGRDVKGVTYGGGHGEPVIFLSPLTYEDNFAKEVARSEKLADDARFSLAHTNAKGKIVNRVTPRGVPGNLVYGQKSTIVHEFFHNVDLELRGGPFWPMKQLDHPEYFDFVDEFKNHPASSLISEYAKSDVAELMAELGSFTFGLDDAGRAMHIKLIKAAQERILASGADLMGPQLTDADFAALLDFSNRYRTLLADMDVFKPTAGGGPYSHLAGMKVRDANAPRIQFKPATGLSEDKYTGWSPEEVKLMNAKAEMMSASDIYNFAEHERDDLQRFSSEYVDKYLDDLSSDIEKNGVQHPVIMQKLSDGSYVVADGNHRVIVGNEMGIDLPVVFIDQHGEFFKPSDIMQQLPGGPGSYYVEQKARLLPQELLDEFSDRFVGQGKHVESNPDVARVSQMFGKWTEGAVANGLLRGKDSIYSGILHDIAGLPTGAATPYNFTEGAAVNLATQSMVRKWDDAFRLQYFSQERSVLERSLNHPMFGMYPASYMWGKIMPELVRFIATEPFGNKTGALLRTSMDVQESIAMQREWDTELDAHIEKLGHAQAMSFFGFMLPSFPWDISASAPAWARSVADEGRKLEETAASGGTIEGAGINVVKPTTDTFKKLVPELTTVPWFARSVGELQQKEPWELEQEAALKAATEDNSTVQGSELGDVLAPTITELRDALR